MQKKLENIFCFWDDYTPKGCYKMFLLRTEYLLSAMNGLRNSSKIWISLRETFSTWIAFTGINKYGIPLPFYLLKGLLKRDFLDIYLTTSCGVRKFKNTSAMRIILLLKIIKVKSKFTKCKNKIQKLFSIFEIIASENVTIKGLY